MVRNRKPSNSRDHQQHHGGGHGQGAAEGSGPSSPPTDPRRKKKQTHKYGTWWAKGLVGASLLFNICYLIYQGIYQGKTHLAKAEGENASAAILGYLETRLNTQLNLPPAVMKSGLLVPDRFWGSYRPGMYFGMKTRSPGDLLFGMMWLLPEFVSKQNLGLNHWCNMDDSVDSFGWLQHDGVNFGIQEIRDRGVKLTTSFVKRPKANLNGGDWTARVVAERESNKTK